MILSAFTILHVVLSLVGIGSGFVFVYGLLTSKPSDRWTTLFLSTTAATSVTGFFFPFHGFTPAIGVGIVSLIVLAVAILARRRFRLAGRLRWTYVLTSIVALYLNFFVLIVQLFQKVPALKQIAPTQSEPPFQIAQLAALLLFAALATRAVMKFHSEPLRMASGGSF
jgi:hypothetical protein